ncbi:MAG: hypothetical protein NTW04_03465 [Elusimicrobia bacterium]|nr:hypothetical protein [Elusimicrobiota bacterium]
MKPTIKFATLLAILFSAIVLSNSSSWAYMTPLPPFKVNSKIKACFNKALEETNKCLDALLAKAPDGNPKLNIYLAKISSYWKKADVTIYENGNSAREDVKAEDKAEEMIKAAINTRLKFDRLADLQPTGDTEFKNLMIWLIYEFSGDDRYGEALYACSNKTLTNDVDTNFWELYLYSRASRIREEWPGFKEGADLLIERMIKNKNLSEKAITERGEFWFGYGVGLFSWLGDKLFEKGKYELAKKAYEAVLVKNDSGNYISDGDVKNAKTRIEEIDRLLSGRVATPVEYANLQTETSGLPSKKTPPRPPTVIDKSHSSPPPAGDDKLVGVSWNLKDKGWKHDEPSKDGITHYNRELGPVEGPISKFNCKSSWVGEGEPVSGGGVVYVNRQQITKASGKVIYGEVLVEKSEYIDGKKIFTYSVGMARDFGNGKLTPSPMISAKLEKPTDDYEVENFKVGTGKEGEFSVLCKPVNALYDILNNKGLEYAARAEKIIPLEYPDEPLAYLMPRPESYKGKLTSMSMFGNLIKAKELIEKKTLTDEYREEAIEILGYRAGELVYEKNKDCRELKPNHNDKDDEVVNCMEVLEIYKKFDETVKKLVNPKS